MDLEKERQKLISTKLYPLAINNLRKVSSDTILQRKTPKEAWSKFLDNMSPEEYSDSRKRALSEQQIMTFYHLLDKIEVVEQQKHTEKLRSSVKSEKMANQFTKINSLKDTNRRLSRHQPLLKKKEIIPENCPEFDSEHSSNIDDDTVLFTNAQLLKPIEEPKLEPRPQKSAPIPNALPPSLQGVQDFAKLKEHNLKRHKQIEALKRKIEKKRRIEHKLTCKMILREWRRIAQIRSRYRKAVRLLKCTSKQITKQYFFEMWKHFLLENKKKIEERIEVDYYPNPNVIHQTKSTSIEDNIAAEVPKRELVLQLKKQLEDQQKLLDECLLNSKKPNISKVSGNNSITAMKRPQSAPKRIKK